MRKYLIVLAATSAAVALSGCASAGQGGAAVLNDLQGCHRHYNGTMAPGSILGGPPVVVTLAVEIDCPQGVTTGVLIAPTKPAVVTAPPANTGTNPAG